LALGRHDLGKNVGKERFSRPSWGWRSLSTALREEGEFKVRTADGGCIATLNLVIICA